ncbi:hypothetical protein HMI55_004027 [Coelomomyces lativittatus]|nr:hypothetical protein HMI56_005893 [Coelomomyces lativittatus]KAJ1500135.1 hypothetical protein HMI55_004027 [Coelomomyces lativittatus]
MSQEGTYLLSCSKDNSNRVWDLRMFRTLSKLKGHQHTSKNFLRAHFAQPGVILGGSEDHLGYIWDQHSGDILKTLAIHQGIVYNVRWHAKQALFASCSDDQTIVTWYYNDTLPIT